MRRIPQRDPWQDEQLRSLRGEPARYKVDDLPDKAVETRWVERARVSLGTCARPAGEGE